MKKVISLFLTVFMLLALLAACSDDASSNAPSAGASASAPSGTGPSSAAPSASGSGEDGSQGSSFVYDPGNDPVTVSSYTWWGGSAYEAIERTAVSYNEKYPNVTINWEIVPGGDYAMKVMTDFSAGIAGDLMQVQEWATQYSFFDKGYMEALDDWITRFNIDKSLWLLGVEDIATYEGHIVVLPVHVSNYLLFYNKDILAECGVPEPELGVVLTFAELVELAEKCATDKYIGLSFADSTVMTFAYPQYMGIEGYKDGVINFKTPELIKYFTDIQDIMLALNSDTIIQILQTSFSRGICAFSILNVNVACSYAETLGLNIGMAFLPTWEKTDTPFQTVGSNSWGMCTKSNQKEHAFAYLAYLASPEGTDIRCSTTSTFPAVQCQALLDNFLEPGDRFPYDYVKTTWPKEGQRIILPYPKVPWIQTVGAQMSSNFAYFLMGDLTPEEYCDELQYIFETARSSYE